MAGSQSLSFDQSSIRFTLKALPIIESLLGEGKIPVICGGTNYYIESLLWKILIDDIDDRYDHVHNLAAPRFVQPHHHCKRVKFRVVLALGKKQPLKKNPFSNCDHTFVIRLAVRRMSLEKGKAMKRQKTRTQLVFPISNFTLSLNR